MDRVIQRGATTYRLEDVAPFLECLPKEDQWILRLYFVQGVSQTSIAKRLGISDKVVYLRFSKALQKIGYLQGDQVSRTDLSILSQYLSRPMIQFVSVVFSTACFKKSAHILDKISNADYWTSKVRFRWGSILHKLEGLIEDGHGGGHLLSCYERVKRFDACMNALKGLDLPDIIVRKHDREEEIRRFREHARPLGVRAA